MIAGNMGNRGFPECSVIILIESELTEKLQLFSSTHVSTEKLI